jgi:hypothetical protein
MQKRFWEFVAPVIASEVSEALKAGVRIQVLGGCKPTASVDGTVSISSGAWVSDSGIVIVEDAVKVVAVPLTPDAKEYTCYYNHQLDQIIGGTPASLMLTEGLVFQDGEDDNKTPLFWVFYPGGSVDLDQSHIIPAVSKQDLLDVHRNNGGFFFPSYSLSSATNVPPVSHSVGIFNDVNGGVVQAHEVLNDPLAAGDETVGAYYTVGFPGYGKPRLLLVAFNVSAGASITGVTVYDRSGVAITTDFAGPIAATGSDAFPEVTITLSPVNADWDSEGPFVILWTGTLAPGAYVRLKSIIVKLMGATE